jgi:hypothetical protein
MKIIYENKEEFELGDHTVFVPKRNEVELFGDRSMIPDYVIRTTTLLKVLKFSSDPVKNAPPGTILEMRMVDFPKKVELSSGEIFLASQVYHSGRDVEHVLYKTNGNVPGLIIFFQEDSA